MKIKNYKLKITFLLFAIYFLQFTTPSLAATPVPTDVPLSEKLSSQINDLKERIASRVAQLKLVERRGIIGIVTDISSTQITLSDLKNETRFIDVDELTKFSSASSKDFGISDIAKGTKLGVLGLYNKESKRTLARFINIVSTPTFFSGVVTSVNNEDFNITILMPDGNQYQVDFETSTKTVLYTKTTGMTKSGFSKIKPLQRIFVIGFKDLKDQSKIIASRAILFPDLPKNQNITIISLTITPTAENETATESGKKTISN